MLQLAVVPSKVVSQSHPAAELSVSHQPSLVFTSLSVERGLRVERITGTGSWAEGSSGVDRRDVIGLDRGHEGKGASLCRQWIGKLSDKPWGHLKGAKEQGCVPPVVASLRGLPPSLYVFLLCVLYPILLLRRLRSLSLGVHSQPRGSHPKLLNLLDLQSPSPMGHFLEFY